MNLMIISTWDASRPDNGARIRAHYLVRALASRHQVTLATFGDVGDDTDGRSLGVADLIRVEADPFRYTRLPRALKYLSPVPLALVRNPEMVQALKPLTGRLWDGVVAIQPMAAPYVSMFRAPFVVDVDTSLSYQMRDRLRGTHSLAPRVRAWLSYLKASLAERRLYRAAQACTVVSSAEIPHMVELVGRSVPNLVVNDNGVDCDLNRPSSSPRKPASLIYNGALTYDANFDAMFFFLAEIYPRIQGFCPDVEMTITGSTRGVLLDRLSLQESVHLSGFVDDVRPLVASSTVCVIPLRKGAGTRLKILEAMALGTPVVSTTKGAEGLDVVDGQHLLIADDRQAFAECVVRLLREEGLRQRLARNARTLMQERYDWRIIADRFVDLVERALVDDGASEQDLSVSDAG